MVEDAGVDLGRRRRRRLAQGSVDGYLTRLAGSRGSLRISARGQVPPHLLRVRGCTAGRPIIVTSLRSTGAGTLTFDTTRLTPHYEGTLKATRRYRLGSRAKHRGVKASLAVRLKLKVYPDR